jgi:hypothetical protein
MIRFNQKWVEEDRGYSTPCHIWTAAKFRTGYGQFDHQNAHRFILSQTTDLTGLQANHLCNQKDCVNVDHLYAGTQVENIADEMRVHAHPNRGHDHCLTCGLELEYRRGQRRCPDSDRRAHRRIAAASAA